MFAYIGCRTTRERNARGKGISVYEITADGWHLRDIVKTIDNPSFLTLDRTGRYLYAVHGDQESVSSFAIMPDGGLEFLSSVASMGRNPVYITVNDENTLAFVATLQGGTVAAFPILENGALGEACYVQNLDGKSYGTVSFAHQCEFDRTGQYLFVPTQGRHEGYERIWVLRVSHQTGAMEVVQTVAARTYSEPRHVVVSSDNKRVYLVNEKGNSITYYSFDETRGELVPLQIIQSLPESYTGEGQASAIIFDKSERFIYATNRIHDSIAMYRVNEATGFLSVLGWIPCMGRTPRFCCRVPHVNEIIVANEDSDTLQFYKIDSKSGWLTLMDKSIDTESPTCIVFSEM